MLILAFNFKTLDSLSLLPPFSDNVHISTRVLFTLVCVMFVFSYTFFCHQPTNESFNVWCYRYAVLASVMVLNLLIAVMSQTFKDVLIRSDEMFYSIRAQLLYDFDSSMSYSEIQAFRPEETDGKNSKVTCCCILLLKSRHPFFSLSPASFFLHR